MQFRKDKQQFEWVTIADYRNVDKTINSYISANQKKYGINFGFHKTGMSATLQGLPAKIEAMLTQDQYSKGVKVLGSIGAHSAEVSLNYKRMSDLRSLCIGARVGILTKV